MKMKARLIIPFFLLLSLPGWGQDDTIINKIHFKIIEKYDNGKPAMLGKYMDTLKTGRWMYFKYDGNLLATGKYKKGKKKGLWRYYFSDSTQIVTKWGRRFTEKVVFKKSGELEIFDTFANSRYMFQYLNGKQYKHYTFL